MVIYDATESCVTRSECLFPNFAELAVGNIVRRVLHIIREEEISIATNTVAGVEALSDSDDNDEKNNEGPALSAAVLAAANRTALRAPSLYNLLESVPVQSTLALSSSGGDSEGKSRCKILL
jgi:translation initiation factor eIF-2B subunit beta